MVPLVSALMPTYNRRGFISRSVQCFLHQDYPNLELIVLDDGTDPVSDLIPKDSRITYVFSESKQPYGAKMNRCFELAHGEFGITLDDDDMYAPNRVSKQIIPMIENPALMVSGTSTLYYYVHGTYQAYKYKGTGNWIGAIAIRKTQWEQEHFDNLPSAGADFRLLRKIPTSVWHDLKDPSIIVAAVHPNNDSKKVLAASSFIQVPWPEVQQLTASWGVSPDRLTT